MVHSFIYIGWTNRLCQNAIWFWSIISWKNKTNIKTIENALEKTLLLRGIEYNDIRIEPEKKEIGLIAQEVELIIPEVVRTNEDDGLKSVEYQYIVGSLVEAIKQLNNKVTNLENILKIIIYIYIMNE